MGKAHLEKDRFYRAALDVPFFATDGLVSHELQRAGFNDVVMYSAAPADWAASLKKGNKWTRGRWVKPTGDYDIPSEIVAWMAEGAATGTGPGPGSPPPPVAPPSLPSDWRARFVAKAREKLGTPYQWGGGHGGKSFGLDCSGLVLVAAKEAGLTLPTKETTANGFWQSLPKVKVPQAGDLAFYGPAGKAQHVVIMQGWDGTRGPTIGANGGDQTTTTPEAAKARNAQVSEVADHRAVRKDFLGFASFAPGQGVVDDSPSVLPMVALVGLAIKLLS